MGFRLPSFPYPPARPEEGYWGFQTSTIDWCEENYYATIYSAEVVNAFTNLLFLALGVKGVRNCLKYDHDNVFLVAFIGYLLVGSGSFLFHSTLKYPMQLVDELSMIYTACLMCYATFSFPRSRVFRHALGFGLASLAVFITFYYHYLQGISSNLAGRGDADFARIFIDPVFHQNAFALITAIVLFRSMYVMEVNIRPSLRAKYGTFLQKNIAAESITKAERLSKVRRDEDIVRTMWIMISFGLTIFLGGFALWGLDRRYCDTIRRWRHDIGLPWGILLEGHGWWHLMTGIGAYFHIVWAIWLRLCLNEKQDDYILNWPSLWFSLPEVIHVPSDRKKNRDMAAGNSYLNGHAKEDDRKSA